MKKILKQISEKNISPAVGYDRLYGVQGKRGRFIIIRMNIKDHPFLTSFINAILVLPLPIGIAKFALRFVKDEEIKQYREILSDLVIYAKGFRVTVYSKEAKIKIKII